MKHFNIDGFNVIYAIYECLIDYENLKIIPYSSIPISSL